jgi:hypothetical protein
VSPTGVCSSNFNVFPALSSSVASDLYMTVWE